MKVLAAFLLVTTLALATQAAAATPAGYRAQLNKLCRSYTPKLKRDEADMRAALKVHDAEDFGIALAHMMRLTLAQDAAIERTPVPAALRAQMTPILRLFRASDIHVRRAAKFGAAGNVQGVLKELRATAKFTPELNRRLDRAGLRDCGSNQT